MELTFKARVAKFWEWYTSVADRFYNVIESGDCPSLAEEVSEQTSALLPGLSWVFGPGENGVGHSFTITGEGEVGKQLLARYWHQQAPELPNWTFYGSRQPSPPERLSDIAIQVGEQEEVDVENFLVQTDVDEENQIIHIVAWHPNLELVPEEHHMQILFLLLDEAMGEFGTQTWIGRIEAKPFEPNERTRSLGKLPEYITHVDNYHQWQKLPPLESYTLYQVNEPVDCPRGDTIVGSSAVAELIFDFIENDGALEENTFIGTGADLVYLRYDNSIFADGNQADERGNIEDTVNEALEAADSGSVLGGAFGSKYSYSEMILFDGANSRAIVDEELAKLNLQGRYTVEPIS
ncbi:MAG: hypothetical protein AAFN77_04160 [Planctomycetota bacterium]